MTKQQVALGIYQNDIEMKNIRLTSKACIENLQRLIVILHLKSISELTYLATSKVKIIITYDYC